MATYKKYNAICQITPHPGYIVYCVLCIVLLQTPTCNNATLVAAAILFLEKSPYPLGLDSVDGSTVDSLLR